VVPFNVIILIWTLGAGTRSPPVTSATLLSVGRQYPQLLTVSVIALSAPVNRVCSFSFWLFIAFFLQSQLADLFYFLSTCTIPCLGFVLLLPCLLSSLLLSLSDSSCLATVAGSTTAFAAVTATAGVVATAVAACSCSPFS
jgi:hypothetical protein